MAYLMALGLTLTLLGVTDLLSCGTLAATVLLAAIAALPLMGLSRRIALISGGIVILSGALWLLMGGMGAIVEVTRALMLHMSGLTTALPMVGETFTVIVCILCAAVSWFVTQRGAGAYPALMLLALSAVLLWLGGWPQTLICLLPAALACVTLLLRAGDEQTTTWRVFPLAVAVTGIAFAGVAAGGATSEPLKKIADDLRRRIYDTFFYTQPRDVFTLATEGYYPQGMSQLGGPAEPREEPVMAVITPRKVYLRGVIKNVYTGRAWVDDIGGRRYLWSASRFEEMRAAAFDQQLPTLGSAADAALLTPRTLQVRMLKDSASTLFVPQRIRQLQAEGKLMPYFNASSEIFSTSNLLLGDVWTMEAPLFTSADSGLSALVNAADTQDPRWEEICNTYLQLPEHIGKEIYEFAAIAVGSATRPYEKALAIENWLASNFVYTLDVAEQNPEQDFVSTFLLITKEGYCTYFASAMTVLCRMAGLPARYVEGYVAYPDSEGLAIVTGKEGHAWTEVYFPGFGWVTFDATPVSVDFTDYPPESQPGGNPDEPEQSPEPGEEPSATPPPDAPTPTPQPGESPEDQQEPEPQPNEQQAPQQETEPAAKDSPWGWIIALLLLILAVIRTILVQPDMQARRQKSEFRRWLVYAQATHDALRCRGLVRGKAESPATFFARTARSGIDLSALAAAENLMFYGHAAPYAEETAAARESFRFVHWGLNGWQKLRFQLQRICLPARQFDITAS